jgi:hypothetical protein
MSSVTRGRWLALTAAALLLVTLLPSAVSAATRPIRFELFLGDACVGGRASDNVTVNVTWRDASRDLKAAGSVVSNDFGYWNRCFGDPPEYWMDADYVLEAGDRIKAKVGSVVRRFVVPILTVFPDRVADVFRGRAPAGDTVNLSYGAPFGDTLTDVDVEARANGRWSYDPGHDLRGGQTAFLEWRSAKQDSVSLSGEAAQLTVTLGRSRFVGDTRPNRPVEIELEDGLTSDVKAVGHAMADPWGGFRGHFEDQDDRIAVAPGDRLRAPDLASDADWIVPRVSGSANAGTDVVRGRCFDTGTSAGFYQIRVLAPNGNVRGAAFGSAGSQAFEVDVGSGEPEIGFDPANIRTGDTVSVGCMQDTGDWVQKVFVVA